MCSRRRIWRRIRIWCHFFTMLRKNRFICKKRKTCLGIDSVRVACFWCVISDFWLRIRIQHGILVWEHNFHENLRWSCKYGHFWLKLVGSYKKRVTKPPPPIKIPKWVIWPYPPRIWACYTYVWSPYCITYMCTNWTLVYTQFCEQGSKKESVSRSKYQVA